MLPTTGFAPAPRAVFVVNDNGNAADGDVLDGVCDTGPPGTPSGVCTLRAAVEQANQTPGQDIIDFSIGTGPVTIVSFGYFVTDGVTIDGLTQPGYAGTPLIEIQADPQIGGTGFWVSADNTIIRGLAITGFTGYGIRLTSSGNVLERNYVGVGLDGVTAAANEASGVYIDGGSQPAQDNDVGLGAQGYGNVISGNGQNGVYIAGSQATQNRVRGNFIGVNFDGTVAVPNGDHGVNVYNGATGNQVGGINLDDVLCLDDCNVISGNGRDGVILQAAANGNTVSGNHIGTGINVNMQIPNSDDGVSFVNADINVVGGQGPQANPNTIAFNGGEGIFSSSPQLNEVFFNNIFDNGGLGIDFGPTGPTPNDSGETDGIANFPTITQAGGGTVSGTLNTFANAPATVYFYANASCDASGFGEGQRVLGSTSGNTDGNGDFAFVWQVTGSVADGEHITATARTVPPGGGQFSRSSEFAACVTYEAAGPSAFVVNAGDDLDDGTCDATHCSIREALDAANARPGLDSIEFTLSGPTLTIEVTQPLPEVEDPVYINGAKVVGWYGWPLVVLEGQGVPGDGLSLRSKSFVDGLAITGFGGNGIRIEGRDADASEVTRSFLGLSAGYPLPAERLLGLGASTYSGNDENGIQIIDAVGVKIGGDDPALGNVIGGNGLAGVAIGFDLAASVRHTVFGDNGGLGIDVGSDGVTDAGRPTINAAYLTGTNQITIEGQGFAPPVNWDVFMSRACDPSGSGEGEWLVAGSVQFAGPSFSFPVTGAADQESQGPLSVTATATDSQGTSEHSECRPLTDYRLVVSPSSQVLDGETQGTFDITVVVENGGQYNADVRLACNKTSSIACSFSPSQAVPGANGFNSTLTVDTEPGPAQSSTSTSWWIGLGGLGLLAMVWGVPTGGPRLRRRLWIAVPMAVALTIASCGKDTTAPPAEDQPVTYSIDVVATATGGLQRTATIEVTVR